MRRTAAIAGTALGAAALAAGSGAAFAGGGAHAHAASTSLHLTANPNGQLKFNTRKLSAKHGTITIQMVNPASSGLDHGVAVSGNRYKKVGKVVHAGKTTTLTVKLKAGKYTFYCPVTGHAAAGMKGTLTIK